MSDSEIQSEIHLVGAKRRGKAFVTAQLVALGTDEDSELQTKLAEKIDDRRPEIWVALDHL